MSETKTINIHTVPQDSKISLDVSGHFYRRIVGMYFNYVKNFTPEKIEELNKAISDQKIDTLSVEQDKIDAYSIETLLILMKDIENHFKEGGFIKETGVEIPIED